jgi:hypothetical protein
VADRARVRSAGGQQAVNEIDRAGSQHREVIVARLSI